MLKQVTLFSGKIFIYLSIYFVSFKIPLRYNELVPALCPTSNHTWCTRYEFQFFLRCGLYFINPFKYLFDFGNRKKSQRGKFGGCGGSSIITVLLLPKKLQTSNDEWVEISLFTDDLLERTHHEPRRCNHITFYRSWHVFFSLSSSDGLHWDNQFWANLQKN